MSKYLNVYFIREYLFIYVVESYFFKFCIKIYLLNENKHKHMPIYTDLDQEFGKILKTLENV